MQLVGLVKSFSSLTFLLCKDENKPKNTGLNNKHIDLHDVMGLCAQNLVHHDLASQSRNINKQSDKQIQSDAKVYDGSQTMRF